MTDPTILFVKPKAINPRDKKALQAAGVIVIEVEDPQSVRLTKACADIDSTSLLRAAVKAIKETGFGNDVKAEFGRQVCATIIDQQTPGA